MTKNPREAGLFSNIVNISSGEYDRQQEELDHQMENTDKQKQEVQKNYDTVDFNYRVVAARKESLERLLDLQQRQLAGIEVQFRQLQGLEGIEKTKFEAIKKNLERKKKECQSLTEQLVDANIIQREQLAKERSCTKDFKGFADLLKSLKAETDATLEKM